MQTSVQHWIEFFESKLGQSTNVAKKNRDLVEGYIAFVGHCIDLQIPPIFENTHLRLLLGLDGSQFGSLLNNGSSRYRKFSIPKRSGGEREISSPIPALLFVQKWILGNILSRIPVADCAHGGIEGRSIITNASEHLGAPALLKMDISDFYGSVGFGFGVSTFRRLGYPQDVSVSLGQFCFDMGSLPQGAATSPSLANQSCAVMDKRCGGLARKYGLKYTRYFDDITFSGPYINERLIEIISGIASESGFKINEKKTRMLLGKSAKYVTGISVGGDKLRLPRSSRRAIRNAAHLLVKTGDALGFANSARDPLVVEAILGRVAFWRHIEPDSEVAQELFSSLVSLRRETDAPIELPVAWRPAPMRELDLPHKHH
jgi:hypothetical protein